ncbi:MAG: peroxiredoxin [Chloroherpetonaceae bacterium]|nr:peroxiredoxin [Chloroherpetonaceae bacterium]
MLTIGDKFPEFQLEAVVSTEKGKEFKQVSSQEHKKDGKWMVIFFWPKDFTFVCPTEIAGFNSKFGEFRDNDAVLYGASTDTAFVHLAWRRDHKDLHDLKFPMLADHAKKLSSALGILTGDDQVALRATFIVDPQGVIRWVSVNDLSVGRNVEETVRVLQALQTEELCPCNWKDGEKTLKVEGGTLVEA